MIIKSINIDGFGKFSGKNILLKDGINLIYGDNGSGKSTLMAFIKMMLYSKAGNEKSSDISKNPRKKYRPLNGSLMSGALVFEHDGCEYHLHKEFNKSPSSDHITLRNLTLGEIKTLTSADEIGDMFLDISVSEFERSIFMDSHGDFSADSTDYGLETRIKNLSTSGNEKFSQAIVQNRLASAKEELISKSGKKGRIVELKTDISELQSKKDLTLSQINEQSVLTCRIKKLEEEITTAENQLKNIDLSKQLKTAQKELNAYKRLFDLHRLTKTVQISKKSFPVSMIFSLFAVFFAVASILSAAMWGKPFLAGLTICVLLIISAAYTHLKSASKTDLEKIVHEIKIITATLGISSDISMPDIEQKITNLTEFIKNNSNFAYNIDEQTIISSLSQKRLALCELYQRQKLPDWDLNELNKLINQKAIKLEALQKRYDALTLAENVLGVAASSTSMGLGAFLSKRTEEYLKVLNDGKHCNVLVSKTLDVDLKGSDDTAYYNQRYMSRGYIDRIYFALRLAAADAVSGDMGKAPLFIDDILSQYDDKSCENALLLLKNRSESDNGQILFFTCHKSTLNMAKEIFNDINEIYI